LERKGDRFPVEATLRTRWEKVQTLEG